MRSGAVSAGARPPCSGPLAGPAEPRRLIRRRADPVGILVFPAEPAGIRVSSGLFPVAVCVPGGQDSRASAGTRSFLGRRRETLLPVVFEQDDDDGARVDQRLAAVVGRVP